MSSGYASKFKSVPLYLHYQSCSAGCRRAQFLARCCSCCTPLNCCNSLRATVFVRIWRYTDLWIMFPERIAVITDPSLGMYRSYCCADAFKPPPSVERSDDQSSPVNNQSPSTSVAAVTASCWCRSRLVHRRNLGIFIDADVSMRSHACAHNEDGIIMFRHFVSDDQCHEPFFIRWCLHSFSVGWTMVMPHCLPSLAT